LLYYGGGMFYFLFFVVIVYIFIVLKKLKKYKYNQTLDYIYELEKYKIDIEDIVKYDNIVLKIRLNFCFLSFFKKPYIDVDGIKHYFEYGARGIRYICISSFENILASNIRYEKLNFYGFKNNDLLSKNILILSPHADDAEISSFGFYKNAKDVTIVTMTAGESGVCSYCEMYKDKVKSSLKKGQLRAFDAVTTSLFGGVEYGKNLALGYFVNSLSKMYQDKSMVVKSKVSDSFMVEDFRKVKHADIKLPTKVTSTYSSLYNDMKTILKDLNPDIIITPHTQIDTHKDHIYSTFIVFDIVKELKLKSDFLLYTNHLSTSETYPVGEMFSSIDLPPSFKTFYFDSIYSFDLEEDTQTDKFFALELNHDLRDSLVFFSLKRAYKYFYKVLRRKITSKDKSYFKRAVRANELFFVVKNENIDKLR